MTISNLERTTGKMTNRAQRSHAQQFEQAIATTFTCRSVVKYNSSLSEEQKNELIADLDATLEFLCERLIANSSIEAKLKLPPLQLAGLVPPGQLKDSEPVDERTLRGLYKVYHTFLGVQQHKGAGGFTARYNEAMSTMNEIQKIVENSHDIYPLSIEDLLQRVRGFITDLYVIFTGFTHAITTILQGNDFYLDTEEVFSMQKQDTESASKEQLVSLKKIYEMHQQLNEKKGTIASRAGDATAFLIFLEESLGSDFEKHDVVKTQLNNVAKLLNDLSYLLSDYENIASSLVQS